MEDRDALTTTTDSREKENEVSKATKTDLAEIVRFEIKEFRLF